MVLPVDKVVEIGTPISQPSDDCLTAAVSQMEQDGGWSIDCLDRSRHPAQLEESYGARHIPHPEEGG